MPRSGSVICWCFALAVVANACGESTQTTSTTARTSPPVTESAHTVTQSTASTQAPKTATPARPGKGAGAIGKAPGRNAEAVKPRGVATTPPVAPKRVVAKGHVFPRSVKANFLAACGAAKGSPSSCGCVLAQQELRKVEKGQSIAELVILEVAMVQKHATLQQTMQRGVLLPEGVQHSLERCKGTKA
jgi:hypothetical protein